MLLFQCCQLIGISNSGWAKRSVKLSKRVQEDALQTTYCVGRAFIGAAAVYKVLPDTTCNSQKYSNGEQQIHTHLSGARRQAWCAWCSCSWWRRLRSAYQHVSIEICESTHLRMDRSHRRSRRLCHKRIVARAAILTTKDRIGCVCWETNQSLLVWPTKYPAQWKDYHRLVE